MPKHKNRTVNIGTKSSVLVNFAELKDNTIEITLPVTEHMEQFGFEKLNSYTSRVKAKFDIDMVQVWDGATCKDTKVSDFVERGLLIYCGLSLEEEDKDVWHVKQVIVEHSTLQSLNLKVESD